ncbi:prephenate dehydratase [Granulosicoccaceae sp. 1_MG-2023]|nr:prephenate dehydratase [Granulosicoccaceae sp. 1_MG-2023]
MQKSDSLEAVRDEIDAIDEQIQALISQRARCAERVAQIKLAQGINTVFYRPEREAQILRRVKENNPGPLSDDTMARLFREIISACLAHEEPMTIAYLGPEGTYTHAAVHKHFGHAVATRPMATIADIFQEVDTEMARYGLVPVENSTEGAVNHTLDMFIRSSLKICGEVSLPIHHNLLGLQQPLSEIRTVYAHQQSLAQCRQWLDAHLPHAEREAVSSNGEAARMVQGQSGVAAIAGKAAGELYGLSVLVNNIEDEKDNTTRFLVIGKQEVPPSGRDSTALLVSAPNRPGGLRSLLKPMADAGISLTRIESRPGQSGLWEYVFFMDIEGHKDDPQIAPALKELKESLPFFRVLGSYPRAV